MTRAFRWPRGSAAAVILGTLAAALVGCSSAAPAPTAPVVAATPPQRAAAGADRDDLAAATIDRPRARWVAVRVERVCRAGTPIGCRSSGSRSRAAASGRAPEWRERLRRRARAAASASAPAEARTARLAAARACAPIASSRRRTTRPAWRPATSSRWSKPRASRAPGLSRRRSTRRRRTSRRATPTGRGARSRRLPAAQRSLRGSEIAWLRDPLDALVLQVQGSGRLVFDAAAGGAADGRPRRLRGAQRPAVPVGRPLADRSGRAARERRVVAGDPRLGAPPSRARRRDDPRQSALRLLPRGAAARPGDRPARRARRGADAGPLDRGRSAERARTARPSGSTPPSRSRREPLRRLVVAQDTGSAIVGAVRADYFWGWGDAAEAAAGRMKQPLRMWALWPAS